MDSAADSTMVRPAERKRETDMVGLASSLRLVTMRLARRLRQQADVGVTPTLLSALHTIDRHGEMSLGELAAHERIRPPTVTRLVSRLEGAGLVVRRKDTADARVSRVALSPEGRRLVGRSRSRKTAYLARRLDGLSQPDREVLAHSVRILEQMLEENGAL
jgi:DNA-binding MarR family transcriptional regulator